MPASPQGTCVPLQWCAVGEGETGFLHQDGLTLCQATAVQAIWLPIATQHRYVPFMHGHTRGSGNRGSSQPDTTMSPDLEQREARVVVGPGDTVFNIEGIDRIDVFAALRRCVSPLAVPTAVPAHQARGADRVDVDSLVEIRTPHVVPPIRHQELDRAPYCETAAASPVPTDDLRVLIPCGGIALYDEPPVGQRVELGHPQSHVTPDLFTDTAAAVDDQERVVRAATGLRVGPAVRTRLEFRIGADQPESSSPGVHSGRQDPQVVVLPRQQCVRTQCHLPQEITSRAKEHDAPMIASVR